MPAWKEPTRDEAAHVTALLASRKVVFRHMFPSGAHVEVGHVGITSLVWLVVWSAPTSEAWPDMCPDASLLRVQMDDRRQQTWAFMGDTEYEWEALLRDAWALKPDLRCEGLA